VGDIYKHLTIFTDTALSTKAQVDSRQNVWYCQTKGTSTQIMNHAVAVQVSLDKWQCATC